MERENIRFQSFYWLANLTRERHKHQPGLELPTWEKQRMRACCLQYKPASEASGPAGAHRSAAREGGAAIKPGGETTREGWEGEAASVRGACGSVLLKQKGPAGTPQRKNPSHLLRTPEPLPQNSCLIQIQSKCTHWSHRNITYCFSMLES